MKLWGSQILQLSFLTNSSFRLVKTKVLSSRNSIVLFRETITIILLRETLFMLVEIDFLASRSFFFYFTDAPASERYFLSGENIFSFHMVETDFLPCGITIFSYLIFLFLQVEIFTEIIGNKFIWERLCSVRKRFSTQWKLFSLSLWFFPASGNRYWN